MSLRFLPSSRGESHINKSPSDPWKINSLCWTMHYSTKCYCLGEGGREGMDFQGCVPRLFSPTCREKNAERFFFHIRGVGMQDLGGFWQTRKMKNKSAHTLLFPGTTQLQLSQFATILCDVTLLARLHGEIWYSSFLGVKRSMCIFDPGGGGGYSHMWTIRECAAQQGMVFASLSLEQGLQISVSVWNRVYFLPFHSGTRSGWLFCCQNRGTDERCCCSRAGTAARSLKRAVSD